MALAMIFACGVAHGQAGKTRPEASDTYEITRRYETESKTNDGSSGSSNGHTVIVERVIGVSEAGVELEYQLPADSKAEERAREWKFPVRVLKSATGPTLLLNRSDIEARNDAWLKAAGLTRADCGRWYFTWNAFQIECDPNAALDAIAGYDLRSGDLRNGAFYSVENAREPGKLVQDSGQNGVIYRVTLVVDPDAIRRARAEADVIVSQIMRKPVLLETALRERSLERIVGTISVMLEADPAGQLRQRKTVTSLETTTPDGRIKHETQTVIVERKLIAETVKQ